MLDKDDWPKIEALRPQLLAYARSVADSLEDAEDLVSDAIERAAKAARRPDGLDPLKHWMFRVIRNLSHDELRKQRVRREYSASAKRLYGERHHRTADIADVVLVRKAFESLSPKEREVLFLIDVAGMSYAEAATIMNVPAGTVMSRVSRARKALLLRIDPDNVVPLRRGAKPR